MLIHRPPNSLENTESLENTDKVSLSVGIRWLGGRSLHTTKSIAHIIGGVVLGKGKGKGKGYTAISASEGS